MTWSTLFTLSLVQRDFFEAARIALLVRCGSAGQPHEDGSVRARPRCTRNFVQLLGEGVEPQRTRQAGLNHGTATSEHAFPKFSHANIEKLCADSFGGGRVALAHVLVSLDGVVHLVLCQTGRDRRLVHLGQSGL